MAFGEHFIYDAFNKAYFEGKKPFIICDIEEAKSVIMVPTTSDYYGHSKGQITGYAIPVKEEVTISPGEYEHCSTVTIDGKSFTFDEHPSNRLSYGRSYNSFARNPGVVTKEEFLLLSDHVKEMQDCCNIDHNDYEHDPRQVSEVHERNGDRYVQSSLEQLADILKVTLTKEQKAIAINNRMERTKENDISLCTGVAPWRQQKQEAVNRAETSHDKSAMDKMTDYMASHNYGVEDKHIYENDPEWQALNDMLKQEAEVRSGDLGD